MLQRGLLTYSHNANFSEHRALSTPTPTLAASETTTLSTVTNIKNNNNNNNNNSDTNNDGNRSISRLSPVLVYQMALQSDNHISRIVEAEAMGDTDAKCTEQDDRDNDEEDDEDDDEDNDERGEEYEMVGEAQHQHVIMSRLCLEHQPSTPDANCDNSMSVSSERKNELPLYIEKDSHTAKPAGNGSVCLPLVDMPVIKIEQDNLEYCSVNAMEVVQQEDEGEQFAEHDEENVEYDSKHIAVEKSLLAQSLGRRHQIVVLQSKQQNRQGLSSQNTPMSVIVPQLLESNSILKTSLLTGAAATLATLTAAAEQIANIPAAKNISTTTSKTTATEIIRTAATIKTNASFPVENFMHPISGINVLATPSNRALSTNVNTTSTLLSMPTTSIEDTVCYSNSSSSSYGSILQTALMSRNSSSSSTAVLFHSCQPTEMTHITSEPVMASVSPPPASLQHQHTTTPPDILKTAVTLATLSEVVTEREKQQQQKLHEQQQQQRQPTQLLVLPQRQVATLPFKKLNFANLMQSTDARSPVTTTHTTTTAISEGSCTFIASASTGTGTPVTTSALSTSGGQHHQIISNCTTKDSNSNSNISNNNNNNSNNISIKRSFTKCSPTIATQTMKLATLRPPTATIQTQTDDFHLMAKETQTQPHTSLMTATVTTTTASSTTTNTEVTTAMTMINTTTGIVTAATIIKAATATGANQNTTRHHLKTTTHTATHLHFNRTLGTPLIGHNTASRNCTIKGLKASTTSNGEAINIATGDSSCTLTSITSTAATVNNTMTLALSTTASTPTAINALTSTMTTATTTATPTATAVTVVVFETLIPDN